MDSESTERRQEPSGRAASRKRGERGAGPSPATRYEKRHARVASRRHARRPTPLLVDEHVLPERLLRGVADLKNALFQD